MFSAFYNRGILRLQSISPRGILDGLPLHRETNRDTLMGNLQSQLHLTLRSWEGNRAPMQHSKAEHSLRTPIEPRIKPRTILL